MTTGEYYRLICDATKAGVLPGAGFSGPRYYTLGHKCVIGLLLSPRQARQVEDLSVADALDELKLTPEDLVENATIEFLTDLQSAHDRNSLTWNPDIFLTEVCEVFIKHGYEVIEPEGCDWLRQDAVPPVA